MILFSDSVNFKEKNFPALYNFLSNYKIDYLYDDMFSLNYEENVLHSHIFDAKLVHQMYQNQNAVYKGIKLFEMYKFELQYKCMSFDLWVDICPMIVSDDDLWEIFYAYFRDELIDCIKLSIFWINYWSDNQSLLDCRIGLFFSGGQIYNRVFCEVMKIHNKPVVGLEHYYTGNDFYFEPRYSPLPNNSLIANEIFYNNLIVNSHKLTDIDCDKKILNAKNKNVSQPGYRTIKNSNYILVLMQVRNDYAVCSNLSKYKNIVKFYIELIEKLLKGTNKNIVIKAHPYEERKLGVNNTILSIEYIMDFIRTLPSDMKTRISVYSDFSVYGLIDGSHHVVTLNSQSGLEAINRGKPVAVLGGAFYQSKGFTWDFDSIDEYISKENEICVNVQNIQAYQIFKKAIFTHLIGKNEPEKIGAIFRDLGFSYVKPVASKPVASKPVASKPVASKPVAFDLLNMSENNQDRVVRLFRKFHRNPILFFKDVKLVRKVLGDKK